MWEKDNFKFTELGRKKKNGLTWILYSMNIPYHTDEYGRHMGMAVAIDKTKNIMFHDTINMQSYDPNMTANWTQEIQNWFDKVVEMIIPSKKSTTAPQKPSRPQQPSGYPFYISYCNTTAATTTYQHFGYTTSGTTTNGW